MVSFVLHHAGNGRAMSVTTRDRVECFSLLLECSSASWVLYNRAEHSRGLLICFMILKESNNSPTHSAEFSNQTFFQSSKSGVRRSLFADKAHYNKSITILVRIAQLIWLANETTAGKGNRTSAKLSVLSRFREKNDALKVLFFKEESRGSQSN